MVDDFNNRKHGRAAVAYPHPDLEPILKPTYGVILYQEQVMQIAQVLAGYSLGGADLLRRAMGKKKPEEMAKQRAIFLAGAQGRGVDVDVASHIFDLMEKFAGYGFNKSHSAAYALVSYQTLWLKAHYPAAFMAAVLSADMDNTDKVVTLIDECRAMGLRVEPPAVNRSAFRFTVGEDGAVIYGIGAIKGVGEAAIEAMLGARDSGGPFRDLWDFCRRIDLHKANRRVLEAMIRAGALDGLGANRATLMAQLPLALKLAEQDRESAAAGQVDLFGALEPVPQERPRPPGRRRGPRGVGRGPAPPGGEGDPRALPHRAPHQPLRPARSTPSSVPASPPCWRPARTATTGEPRTLAGLVVSVRQGKTQRGRMGSVVLDDRTGRIEVAVFNEVYEQVRDLLAPDRILVATGAFSYDDYRDNWSLRADRVRTLEDARAELASYLELTLDLGTPQAQTRAGQVCDALEAALSAYRGGTLPVQIEYIRPGSRGRLRLGPAWRVQPRDELTQTAAADPGGGGGAGRLRRRGVSSAPPGGPPASPEAGAGAVRQCGAAGCAPYSYSAAAAPLVPL